MATEYIVLRSVLVPGQDEHADSIDGWRVIGTADATTPQQAIRAATNGKPADERTGTFVAVSARSWKPTTRKVETVERDKWE